MKSTLAVRFQPSPTGSSNGTTVSELVFELQRLDVLAAEYAERAERVVAAMPLSSSDYGRSLNHIRNAAHYADRREQGAAQFEQRSLVRYLTAALTKQSSSKSRIVPARSAY